MDTRFYILRGVHPDTGQVVELAVLDCLERVVRLKDSFRWDCSDEFRQLEIVESDSKKEPSQ